MKKAPKIHKASLKTFRFSAGFVCAAIAFSAYAQTERSRPAESANPVTQTAPSTVTAVAQDESGAVVGINPQTVGVREDSGKAVDGVTPAAPTAITYTVKEPDADSCYPRGPVGSGIGIYLPGLDQSNAVIVGGSDGFDYKFIPSSTVPTNTYTEDANTAHLVGHLESTRVPGYGWDIDITFVGHSSNGSNIMELSTSCYVPPFGTGGPVNPNTWFYYNSFNGTLTGTGRYSGATVGIQDTMHNFQVGEVPNSGASGKNINPGASGWFTWTVTHQPTDTTIHLRNSSQVNPGNTWYGDLNFNLVAPGLDLLKLADKTIITPGGAVTFTYKVTNSGNVTLTNIVVTDDNGTPNNTADDFPVGTIASLAPGSSQTLSKTVNVQPGNSGGQDLCVIINGMSMPAGTLTVTDQGSSIKVVYVQSQGLNDNRYGTGATAATGWNSGHKFNDLVGSDEAEFKFTDSTGATVLDFKLDYISAATGASFPNGSATYPSGYGTLGVNGGDGKMITGSASSILSATTSLTENLKIYPTGYLTNSPPETSPNSGTSTVAPLWDYNDSYTVVVSKAAFTNGFGGVTIAGAHNSPPKKGNNLVVPTPCGNNSCVTNLGKATTTSNGQQLIATSSATVCFGTNNCAGLIGCTPPYPFMSGNPKTNIAFNESEVLRGAKLGFDANCKPTELHVFYNDEHALTLGVRQVKTITTAGTSTTDYPVTPLTSNPGSATSPQTGATEAQGGTDVSGRPIFPALFITDVTANPGNPTAGDWQNGGTSIPPDAVYGTWKAAVRTIDNRKATPVMTVTPDADPAKNNNTYGPGAPEPAPAGLANQGYGAEIVWDLTKRNLISGHQYRVYFMVHDGDQNKSGGDVGQACATFNMP